MTAKMAKQLRVNQEEITVLNSQLKELRDSKQAKWKLTMCLNSGGLKLEVEPKSEWVNAQSFGGFEDGKVRCLFLPRAHRSDGPAMAMAPAPAVAHVVCLRAQEAVALLKTKGCEVKIGASTQGGGVESYHNFTVEKLDSPASVSFQSPADQGSVVNYTLEVTLSFLTPKPVSHGDPWL